MDDRALEAMRHERRKLLVVAFYAGYVSHLPDGSVMPPCDEWDDQFIESLADTPRMVLLDRQLEEMGQHVMYEHRARWQAGRS